MASTGDQKYEEYLNDEVYDKDIEEQDDDENNAVVIIDGDGNYYFQSTDKMVKIESVVETSTDEQDTTAQENIKSENSSKEKESSSETSKDQNQEVYEFDENEQDADDPPVADETDCKSKAVVKSIKKKSTGDESFACILCPYTTNKKFLLSKHLKNHSDERPFKCSVCERGFKTSISLINHENTHLGHKPHACKDCDKSFTTPGELVRHVRYRHTHIKPHKCTECEYRSVELSKLKRHMRCHTGERPYQCPHCTYASPDTFKLKRHLRTHTGEKPYECDICHARFTQLNSLKHHRLIHSVNEKPVFQCNLCPTTCGRKTDLRLHIQKLHNTDQPIPCKRCGKNLPDRYSYKMHIKTHQGEKCYRCEYCPYAAVSQRLLNTHVLIHLDEKPFECEICHACYRQKQLYTRHMNMYHSDTYVPPRQLKKDRKCPHCDKMFAFNGNLIRHMETHDPNSRLSEEKHNLKLGRMKRIQKDGTEKALPKDTPKSSSDEYECKETRELQVKNEGLNEEQYVLNCNYENDVNYVYEDFETDDYVEEAHEQEVENEQNMNKKLLIEVKIENMNETDNVKRQLQQNNSSKLKTEGNSEDEITLEANDDQGFMVIEVLPNDDEDDDVIEDETQTHQENAPKIVLLNDEGTTNNEALTSDYFGFEVEEEEEEDDDGKDAIKLLEMIEQE